ncbi:MAG: glucosylceramidase [Chitinophagaceae bacterium]|nr:glucosylceramidase [Chitinophagaceae bacterium]
MNLLALSLMSFIFYCSPKSKTVTPIVPPPIVPVSSDMDCWITRSDQSMRLEKQNVVLRFDATANSSQNIQVDETQTVQTIEGFGYTLTGGSAQVISQLNATVKAQLLQELFGTNTNSIGISYLRISLGASDLNSSTFSYDDMPAGQTDLALANFSLAPDKDYLIPLLKEILLINPNIKIMSCPWSPPVWMKDNNSTIGGSLQPKYYDVYARYFVKYIQMMKAEGIPIDAITPQNEPLNPANNPSLLMLATEQANFVKNNLGPAFQAAGISTKIIIYDHNCDKPEYPLSILNDAAAKQYVSGSAFHLYGGSINVLSSVHSAHPDKGLYFTEQWTSSTGDFGGDLRWHIKNVVIGSMLNWSKVALEWNLANDANYGPHTIGGCTQCKGAITVNNPDSYSKNVAFYIIAHASKFVPAGSVRIASNISGNLNNVAFKTPLGKIVLLVENDGNATEVFNIKYHDKWVNTSLEAGAVATYVW